MMSSLLDMTFSGFVAFGTPSFSIFISSWLLFLVSRSIMMVWWHCSGCHGLGQRWYRQGSCPILSSNCRDHATLPGPPDFLSSTWCTLYPLPITQDDVAVWPYSVDILLVFSSFLASLHWPHSTPDLGKFGISYLELLLMFEIFTGHRLHTGKSCSPPPPSPSTPVFSDFLVGIGQEIRHGCQFLHSLFRALGHLPGGLAGFIPCQPSAHCARFVTFRLGAVWTWSLLLPS